VEIGEEQEIIVIEPVEDPVPSRRESPERPVEAPPEPEQEPVPA
jgi:hypothetical protein